MQKERLAKSIPYLIGGLVLLILAASIYWVVNLLANVKKEDRAVVAQQITLITPPPPPPPPPPEPIKEPEVIEETPLEEVQEAVQEDAMEESAGEDLGLDAEGGAGGDGFGLIGRKGGTGIGLGKAGRYEIMVKEKLIDLVNSDEELRYLAYSGLIKVWVKPDGKIEKYSIDLESGSQKVKSLLEELVKNLTFSSGPPLETADKAINLRITSRI